MSLSAPQSLLPANPSFAGHQTFAIRTGWIKKGIDALQDNSLGGPGLFARDDALVTLGVGKNMVQSIRHWLLVTRMAMERAGERARGMEPTPLGRFLFGAQDADGADPFLEDDATLWLLHWQLAGPASSSFSWVWAFNVLREFEFSRDGLVDSVYQGAIARVARPPARETIGRDVDCLLHTYTAASAQGISEDSLDCPLIHLGLLRPAFGRYYRFDIGPKPSLPPAVFAYALQQFWQWRNAASPTLTVRDVVYAEGGPGRVFKLDEDSILEYLDGLAETTDHHMRFEDTALSRQVVRGSDSPIDPLTILQKHYHA